jgi:hypothetical protein
VFAAAAQGPPRDQGTQRRQFDRAVGSRPRGLSARVPGRPKSPSRFCGAQLMAMIGRWQICDAQSAITSASPMANGRGCHPAARRPDSCTGSVRVRRCAPHPPAAFGGACRARSREPRLTTLTGSTLSIVFIDDRILARLMIHHSGRLSPSADARRRETRQRLPRRRMIRDVRAATLFSANHRHA